MGGREGAERLRIEERMVPRYSRYETVVVIVVVIIIVGKSSRFLLCNSVTAIM